MEPATAILATSSFFMGLSRGGLSGGVALVGVLLATQVMEPINAAAFLLPLLILTDPFSIIMFRKTVDKPSLKVLMPGLVAGLAIGYLTVSVVDANVVRVMVGTLAVILVIDGVRGHVSKRATKVFPAPVGTALGAVSGFSSFLIHSGMPPVAAYLLPKRMPRSYFLGTTAVLFTIANLSKIVPYHLLGIFKPELLWLSAKMLPAALAGIIVGKVIHNRISDKAFYIFIYTSVLFLGLRQFWLALG